MIGPRDARPDRGFTLLEVLVAVGLLALVSTLMYEAMALTFRARETISRIEDLNHAAQVALHYLTRDISMAYLSNHVDRKEPAATTLFIGSEDSLLFTYLGHERRQRGAKESDQGVVEYRVERDPDGEGFALIRREKSPPDTEPERGGNREVLVSRVREFRLRYWDEKQEDWRDEWKAEMEEALKSGLGGDLAPQVAPAGSKLMKAAQDQMLEEFRLPSRVYIRLVIEDVDGTKFAYETQSRVHLQYPLNF